MTTSRLRKTLYWALPVLAVAALALGVVRALDKRSTQAERARAAAEALQTTPVYEIAARDLITVRRLPLQQTAAVSGSLEALQTVAIKARVAGELRELSKREGDSVAANEVVARIDPTEPQARVRQAEQQAESALAQVRIAQRNQDNNQALVKQGFISATALATSQANLAAAEATHRAAVAALDIARKSLADTVLRSPIAGQVAARPVQNGERVGVDTRVLEVVDLSAFEMEAALSPADAARIQTGLSARLVVEGLAEPVAATVARINPSVQAGSRSVLVYLRLNAVPGMRQGLFARGEIVAGAIEASVVPVSAIRNDKPEPYLQVLRDGAVKHVPLAPAPAGSVDGVPHQAVPMLAEGDTVLAATAGAIRDGTRVNLAATRP
ncbi:MAG: efflux RND transporter periplasmic adaptor subunit [Hydrogenophaga sp.]|uniref:efflux RND transporter periplasmic adaptor subunit n=1 Tax=Hydrogenophaga sp. TaxID=1904254 RepID=UPI00169E39C1|nr:efflux RND transporter periplasmic adaptor subunit [Hydrogenophaga sp.]NIM41790.1 efflux RND transporter periplasmic adaptor subunit [Hydrogenophaga sp.]NIN27095.1 efflux RND transporter periplasmic adaptor subunit [Hydrogenophaga sp.]NIN31796.1 efflux RND transporter periplasmic adaptor subunit [Hydrogenophaga sp.]NIN56040.1 efflux RND transporter periplasmic adaptor subunit [Hydrogenophaga sp.]NIO52167.1 efflux RND transporter periplasmic adaptor subunit [Hydrogenophaga sp.]